jgi:hypothetical protein
VCTDSRVIVRRFDGDMNKPVSVNYATKDGTAMAGIDYTPVQVRIVSVCTCARERGVQNSQHWKKVRLYT